MDRCFTCACKIIYTTYGRFNVDIVQLDGSD